MNDDLSLLRDYARRNSQDAFAALVSRHVNVVYSVALRQVRDSGLAEEITQAAFIILARKAGSLGDKTILSAWLCRTARYLAANALKIQYRRQRREEEAQSIMNETATDETWPQIAPLLDSAMDKLQKKDHDALVLRFFENQNFREIGLALGGSENAAKMRVSRALEKLRRLFAKKGVHSTTAIIAGTMSANSIQAAPEMLTHSVTAAALTKGAAASASTLTLIKGALKIMAWTHMKTAAIAGAAALITVAGATAIIICTRPTTIQSIPQDWSVLSGKMDEWSSANGKIAGHSVSGDSILASGNEYRNVEISAIVGTSNRESSLAFRMQDANNGYIVVFAPKPTSREDAGHIALIKRVDGSETALATYNGRIFSALGQSAKIAVTAKGPNIQVRMNDVTVIRHKDATFSSGSVGLRIYGEPLSPCDATFSNLTIY